MPELDAELLERVARWCAEAGRSTVAAEIRRALAPLGWDELLAARALLADPPPARPLGPFALADLARGAPADVAAERERGGRYPAFSGAGEPDEPLPASPSPAATQPSRKAGRARPRRAREIVIRRARDVAPPLPAPAPASPPIDELLLPEGRAVLERLVRRHGARRAALVAALAAGWRTPDGRAPDDADLSRLLDAHGLARTFARRERDELLHVLRASGGLRTVAAARLGLEPAALDEALARVGAAADAERIREARRAELRARATIAQRVRLLLGDTARLEDLGLVGELEADLRRRLPEHVRAIGASGAQLLLALAQSLSVSAAEARELVERFGLAIAASAPPPAGPRLPATSPRGTSSGARRPAPSRPRAARSAGAGRAGAPARGRPPERRPGSRPGPGQGPRPSRAGAAPGARPERRPGSRPGPGQGPRPARPAAAPGARGERRPGSGQGSRPPRPGGRRPPPRGPPRR